MIELSINWQAMLWFILIMWILKVPIYVIIGASKAKRSENYGWPEIVDGLVTGLVLIYIIVS